MMNIVKDELYFNNILEALKYKLYFKGEKLFLQCIGRLILEDVASVPAIKISVNFGAKLQQYEDTDFSNSFMLVGTYSQETQLLTYEIELSKDLALNDLWMTTKLSIDADEGTIYRALQGQFEVFEEEAFDRSGVLQVSNFIDTRIVHEVDKDINTPEMSEQQIAQQEYMNVLAATYKKQYATRLYYSFCGDSNREMRLLFGVDLSGFVLENSYIPQLADDPLFNDYLKAMKVDSVDVTVYGDGFAYGVPSAEGVNSFEMAATNVFNGSLDATDIDFKSKLLDCRASVTYQDPIQNYLNTTLVPALQAEIETLYSLTSYGNSTELDIYNLNYSQIKNTLFYASLILFNKMNNLGIIASNADYIYCDEQLLNRLVLINQMLQDYFKKLIANNAATSAMVSQLQINFDEKIEVPPKSKYVDVIQTQKTGLGLPSVLKGDFAAATKDYLFKYFDSTTAQIGSTVYDLNSISYGCLPARMMKLNDEQFINYFSFTKNKLTSKEIYDYYNALLKIIEINSDQEVKLPPSVKLGGITNEQYLAQERSRQLSFMLDSLTILAQSIDPTESAAQANVFSTSIDLDIQKLPDSLKTNACLDDDTTAAGTTNVDVTGLNVTNALPASLFAPIVAKTVQAINETSLYNYKSVFSESSALTNLQGNDILAVPLVFAAQSYAEGATLKGFEASEPVLTNFINFALLYFMIKYLFRIEYLDVEADEFKTLDSTAFINNLETNNRDLLCRVSPYKSGALGVSQPKLLSLPIYSRHFVIKK